MRGAVGVVGAPTPWQELLAEACRVVAASGLTLDVLGHVSLRLLDDAVLVRCRGPHEAGLAATGPDDIRLVDRDGRPDDDGWTPPRELPIHTAVLRARPDVTAVLHTHPPAVVTTTLAGLDLLPLVGAYDITAASLAAAGIPTWPRAALVHTEALGARVAAALGGHAAVRLHGHGLVTVGRGDPETAVAEAVVNAVAIESLAGLTLAVAGTGATPTAISAEDLAQLPDVGGALLIHSRWRHLLARAGAAR